MKTKATAILLAFVGAAIWLVVPRVVRACGPFFPELIFVNTQHPDLPIGSYMEGTLGVLQPSYSSIYLVVAYDNLMGISFSPVRQVALWDGNTALTQGQNLWPVQLHQGQQAFEAQRRHDWRKAWDSAVGKSAAPVPPQVQYAWGFVPGAGIFKQSAIRYTWGTAYSQYLNCPQDAFRFALTTLDRMTGRFGETSPVVNDWTQAQETVFGDCSEGNAIPDPLPSTAPAVARDARAYQIAAAHFYTGNFEQAAADFRAIGANPSSQWSTIAPYLVARSLVRQAGFTGKSGFNLAVLTQAETQVNSILGNPKYAKYHRAAEQLRGFIEFRLHPQERLVELANNLTSRPSDPSLRQDAIDFTRLFPIVREEGAYAEPQPVRPDVYSKLAGLRAKSGLIDWLMTFKLDGPQAFDDSYDRWKATGSPAWLIAALTKAPPNDPRVPELLAAAAQVPLDKAYDSVTFQRLRLMLLQGKKEAVRKGLADALAADHGRYYSFTPRSTINLYTAMKFELARNLGELFAYAPRVPALITDSSEPGELPGGPYSGYNSSEPRLDGDAITALNRFLPVALLAKAVEDAKVPQSLRREIALAAWTRAALLGNRAVARTLAPAVDTFEPELRPSVQAYESAASPAARRFAVALTALQFPGLRPFVLTYYKRATWGGVTPLDQIDDYRQNWWGTQGPECTMQIANNAEPNYAPAPLWPTISPAIQAIYAGGKIDPPAFLSERDRAEAKREWQRLMTMSPAPDYLSAEVLAWAKAHPSDPRDAEALALAVRSTRFGCVDSQTGELSKAAFGLLHRRYPNSSWAKQTKYWFKM